MMVLLGLTSMPPMTILLIIPLALVVLPVGLAAAFSLTDNKDLETFRARVQQADTEAQVRLGDLYAIGRGYTQARAWYEKAAPQGHPNR